MAWVINQIQQELTSWLNETLEPLSLTTLHFWGVEPCLRFGEQGLITLDKNGLKVKYQYQDLGLIMWTISWYRCIEKPSSSNNIL